MAPFTTGKQGMCYNTCEKMSISAPGLDGHFLLVGKRPKPSNVPASQLRDFSEIAEKGRRFGGLFRLLLRRFFLGFDAENLLYICFCSEQLPHLFTALSVL